MGNEVALEGLAVLLTYLLHSTLLLGGVWFLTRTRLVRSYGSENNLWRVALVGALLTTGVQTLGFEPVTGRVTLGSELAKVDEPVAATLPRAATLAKPVAVQRAGTSQVTRVRRRAPSADPAPSADLAPSADPAPSADLAPTTVPMLARLSEPARDSVWPLLLAGLWVALALAGVARFLGLRRELERVLAGRAPARDPELLRILQELVASAGITREVKLSVAPLLPGPVALPGWEIALPPRALEELDERSLRAVLAHELAHLVRRDPLTLQVAALFEAVFFFQPLNRLARQRMQDTAEFVCDDWAVARTGRGWDLARSLAQVAEWIDDNRRPLPAAGMARRGSALIERVERLMRTETPAQVRPLRAAAVGALLVGAVSCGVPVVSVHGESGLLARLLAAWNAAEEIHGLEGEETLVLRVVDGKVVDVRRARAEGISEPGVEPPAPTGSGPEDAWAEEWEGAWDEEAWAEEWEESWDEEAWAEEWEEAWDEEAWAEEWEESWDEEAWAEEWEDDRDDQPESGEPRWDSRSLRELGEAMAQLENDYQQHLQRAESQFGQAVAQLERQHEKRTDQTARAFEKRMTRWSQEYEKGHAQRRVEWSRAVTRMNQELAELRQRAERDPEAYREIFEEWQQEHEEARESHESDWSDWEDHHRDQHEELVEAYDEEQAEVVESYLDEHAELLDERAEQLDELHDWFDEAYEELLERFESNCRTRQGRNCDHDCEKRCSRGCTHPDPEPRPEPQPEPEPAPQPKREVAARLPG